MELLLGILLAAGVLLVYVSVLEIQISSESVLLVKAHQFSQLLFKAGLVGNQQWLFLIVSILIPLLVGSLVFTLTQVIPVAVAVATAVAPLPWGWLRARLQKRQQLFAGAWPDIVDSLLTAVRAGVSLPEAVVQLSHSGPEITRTYFQHFAMEYRSSGKFDVALTSLQSNFADKNSKRVFEVIRLGREVGGSEMGNILRDLSAMMRENLRISGEIQARQSWTVNAARLAVAAPWIVLLMISMRTDAASSYSTTNGMMILALGGIACTFAYWLMQKLGSFDRELDK